MPLARAWSVALLGVDGHVIEVEADLSAGLPGLSLVGLPDAALSEARDRVRAAVHNSKLAWPTQRITVGLSPAALPKAGSGFDVAIAAAVLAANGTVPADRLAASVLIGELGLDGRLRSTRGVLPAVLAAVRAGWDRIVVPAANAAEAALIPGVQVCGVEWLTELVAELRGEAPVVNLPTVVPPPDDPEPDLADVVGQDFARFALEVAAAGGHHLFLHGAPGAGKTMLASRLPGILPSLSDEHAVEVTAVHSVAGLFRSGASLIRRPPLQAPHHSATMQALVGGGGRVLRPGAASIAHRGVLFLDEAPEFRAGVVDALRQPLESGVIEIARATSSARFPARFQLVLAANPCPAACADVRSCTCPSLARRRYLGRLSGALLDRIDLRVEVLPASRAALLDNAGSPEPTAALRARVLAARAAAQARLAGTGWVTNSEVPGAVLRGRFRLPKRALAPAMTALDRGRLSARGYDRILRISWTLADLAGRSEPGPDEVRVAIELRSAADGSQP